MKLGHSSPQPELPRQEERANQGRRKHHPQSPSGDGDPVALTGALELSSF